MKLDIGRWTLDAGRFTRRSLPACRALAGRGLVGWTFIAALGFFCSCQSNSAEQPSLTDEKIARIMADISIADAATTGLTAYKKDSLMQAYFKQVFEIHGVTLETYEKDLRIIAKDLTHMDSIVKKADALLTENGTTLGKPLGK